MSIVRVFGWLPVLACLIKLIHCTDVEELFYSSDDSGQDETNRNVPFVSEITEVIDSTSSSPSQRSVSSDSSQDRQFSRSLNEWLEKLSESNCNQRNIIDLSSIQDTIELSKDSHLKEYNTEQYIDAKLSYILKCMTDILLDMKSFFSNKSAKDKVSQWTDLLDNYIHEKKGLLYIRRRNFEFINTQMLDPNKNDELASLLKSTCNDPNICQLSIKKFIRQRRNSAAIKDGKSGTCEITLYPRIDNSMSILNTLLHHFPDDEIIQDLFQKNDEVMKMQYLWIVCKKIRGKYENDSRDTSRHSYEISVNQPQVFE